MLVKCFQETSSLDEKELAKLQAFSEDPAFAELLAEQWLSQDKGSKLESIAGEMTSSWAKTAPAPSKQSKAKGKSTANQISDVINIAHSDDDYEMGDRVFMQQQLQEFPWQSYGLTPDLVAPALHAIKTMPVKGKALFANDTQVKEIFQLGLKAWKDNEASHADSSNASDSSNKRSHSFDGKHSTSKKPCKMGIGSETFTPSISTKNKGKARRCQIPVFMTDEEDGAGDDVGEGSGEL
jgi:hypothetical protein